MEYETSGGKSKSVMWEGGYTSAQWKSTKEGIPAMAARTKRGREAEERWLDE